MTTVSTYDSNFGQDKDSIGCNDFDESLENVNLDSQSTYKRLIHIFNGIHQNSSSDLRPIDYFSNPDYHRENHTLVVGYLILSKFTTKLLATTFFHIFFIATIVVAGVNVGIQTYPELGSLPQFDILDEIILAIFSFECAGKIISEGLRPLRYFIGPEYAWNIFDFLIVLFSMPFFSTLFGI